MIRINPESINDLVALKEAGIPVTLTSHPGNASLYKLVLWACGIPEHLWDVTCCKADENNWPMYQLEGGEAKLLVSDELHKKVMTMTNPTRRAVVAYQKTCGGVRLGRHHVKAMQAFFPNTISSCSRMLLSEKETVREMFDYLARTKASEVFARYISPDGIMRPMPAGFMGTDMMADSFISLLEELDHLLFCDKEIETKGGACYDGVMISLSVMLVQFWKSGRTDRYDISGPDMIHYATRSGHQQRLSEMIDHLRKWNKDLVPEHILIQMFPGTVARVGHLENHVSQDIMERKIKILTHTHDATKEYRQRMQKEAKDDQLIWPIEIQPNKDKYFSQYDLLASGKKLVVDPYWRDIPIRNMRDALLRANSTLRI